MINLNQLSRCFGLVLLVALPTIAANIHAGDREKIVIGELTLSDAAKTQHAEFKHDFIENKQQFRFYDGIISPCNGKSARDCQRLVAFIDNDQAEERILIDSYHPDGGEARFEAVSFYNLDEDPGKELIVLISRYYNSRDINGYAYTIHFYDDKISADSSRYVGTRQLVELPDILPKKIAIGFDGMLQNKKSSFSLKTIAAIKARLDAQNQPFTF